MPRRVSRPSEEASEPIRPASTPDARETQMIELADQLAERQLRDGTASSQVITHYLKLGSSRERLEQNKLVLETSLIEAKAEQIKAMADQQDLFEKAIRALRGYQGQSAELPEDDEYDER